MGKGAPRRPHILSTELRAKTFLEKGTERKNTSAAGEMAQLVMSLLCEQET